MKVYHGRTDIERFEHLVETPSQTVTHLVLPAGQAIGQHHVPYTVVVVPVKGRILFSDEKETAEIYPALSFAWLLMKYTPWKPSKIANSWSSNPT